MTHLLDTNICSAHMKRPAGLTGQELKLAKFSNVFPWHHHEDEPLFCTACRGIQWLVRSE